MGKNELFNNISETTGLSRESCEKFFKAYQDEIVRALMEGEKIIFKGFMSMEVTTRSERKGRDPKTGNVTTFPAVKSVKCRMSQEIKDRINNK